MRIKTHCIAVLIAISAMQPSFGQQKPQVNAQNFQSPFNKKLPSSQPSVISPSQGGTPSKKQHSNVIYKTGIRQNSDNSVWLDLTQTSNKRSAGQVSKENFFTSFSKQLNIREDDHFTFKKSEQDQLGYTHHYYQQNYKGIPVYGGTLILHEKMEEYKR